MGHRAGKADSHLGSHGIPSILQNLGECHFCGQEWRKPTP